MKRVLILTSRPEDGAALRDLLADAGHQVAIAPGARLVAEPGWQMDVIVADFEPWTWEGRALLEAFQPTERGCRLVMLCARGFWDPADPAVVSLQKPISLVELERAIAGEEPYRREEAA
jgi:DNA-binding NtrC family response regulator